MRKRVDCNYIDDPGEYHGYTVDGVTMTESVFHKVSYYDNYRFLDDGLMPATVADGSFNYVATPGGIWGEVRQCERAIDGCSYRSVRKCEDIHRAAKIYI